MKIKAIETKYSGRYFRSRLEARWAVWFAEMGIKWEYEIVGMDLDGERYLPDFFPSRVWLAYRDKANGNITNGGGSARAYSLQVEQRQN